MVARRAHNPKVVGSSPISATNQQSLIKKVISLRDDFFVCFDYTYFKFNRV